MSEQEIIEGNKLIAEFIGFSINQFGEIENLELPFQWMATYVNCIYDIHHKDFPLLERKDYYKFHSSWDWLMPVVEKIESLNIRNNGYDFPKVKFLGDCVEIFTYATYRGTTFYWKGYMGLDGKCYNHLSNQKNSKIEAVWCAVVEFIKWYNQWKKEK